MAGSTAPLWTAALALLHLLPGSFVAWAKAAGALLYLAGIAATYRVGRELDLSPGLARLAAGLSGATTWLVWSALAGMEVPLFVLLSLVGTTLHLRERRDPRRPPLALPTLAVAALARPEGFLLLALAGLDRLIAVAGPAAKGPVAKGPAAKGPAAELAWRPPPWRRLLVGGGVALGVVAPALLFHLAAEGSALPTTFTAKADVGRLLPDPRGLFRVIGIFFLDSQYSGSAVAFCQPFATLLAGAGVVALARRLGGERDRGLLPALWLLGLPLVHTVLTANQGNFGRYFFPLFPFLTVLAAVGLEPLWQRWTAARPPRWASALAVGLLLLPTATGLLQGAPRYAQTVANVEDSDVAMARWIGERVSDRALLAVNDIGAFGYLTDNPLLDLGGIIDPEVARRARTAEGGDWQSAIARLLVERRPDYLVVFPNWFPAVVGPDSPYEPLVVLPVPNNITMGGDRLVLYATPWTRHPLTGDRGGLPGGYFPDAAVPREVRGEAVEP